MLRVAFAGLPSAGKSTMINALAGKRVLESGICRTTTEVCLVGSTNTVGARKWVPTKLESDDGVEFCALDLPGICDAEDASRSFNKVTREWATKCDVVVWVTDARTAFLTTHEARELEALRSATQEKADEDGTLYQFLVVLAKYDASVGTCAQSSAIRLLEGEIRTDTEDTTVDEHFARAERMFPDTRVVKFSAFARIAKCGSDALRALVSAHTDGSNCTFDIKWATENLVEKRFAQMTRALRITRNGAVAAEKAMRIAETRLDEADARVDAMLAALTLRLGAMSSGMPVPFYDTPAEFVFLHHFQTSTTTVFSLPVMLDGAVDVAFTRGIRQGTVRLSPGLMRFETGMCCGGYSDKPARVTQLVAPVVRPKYGDVFVDPVSVTHSSRNGNRTFRGENEHFCVQTGRDVGPTYVLKVGEVARDRLDALLALTLPIGCVVTCVLK
jgi:GTPase Era involved in 16S rRNA processing